MEFNEPSSALIAFYVTRQPSLGLCAVFDSLADGSLRLSIHGAANDSINTCAGLDVADLVVVCQKLPTGWDEWRVIAVCLCNRISSCELLMQLLAQSTHQNGGDCTAEWCPHRKLSRMAGIALQSGVRIASCCKGTGAYRGKRKSQ